MTDGAAVNRKACSRTRHLPNSPFFTIFFLKWNESQSFIKKKNTSFKKEMQEINEFS